MFREIFEDVNRLVHRPVQGTIELAEGHLYSGKLQMESAIWLIDNLPDEVLEYKL